MVNRERKEPGRGGRREARLASKIADQEFLRKRRVSRCCLITGIIATGGVGFVFDVWDPYGYKGPLWLIGVPIGIVPGWVGWRILEQKTKWPVFWAAFTSAFIAALFASVGWRSGPGRTPLVPMVPLGAAMGAIAGHLLRGASSRRNKSAPTATAKPEDGATDTQPATSEPAKLRRENAFVWLLRIVGVAAGAGLGSWLAFAIDAGLLGLPTTSSSVRLLVSSNPILFSSLLVVGSALGSAVGLKLGERHAPFLWAKVTSRIAVRRIPPEHQSSEFSGQGTDSTQPAHDPIQLHPMKGRAALLPTENAVGVERKIIGAILGVTVGIIPGAFAAASLVGGSRTEDYSAFAAAFILAFVGAFAGGALGGLLGLLLGWLADRHQERKLDRLEASGEGLQHVDVLRERQRARVKRLLIAVAVCTVIGNLFFKAIGFLAGPWVGLIIGLIWNVLSRPGPSLPRHGQGSPLSPPLRECRPPATDPATDESTVEG